MRLSLQRAFGLPPPTGAETQCHLAGQNQDRFRRSSNRARTRNARDRKGINRLYRLYRLRLSARKQKAPKRRADFGTADHAKSINQLGAPRSKSQLIKPTDDLNHNAHNLRNTTFSTINARSWNVIAKLSPRRFRRSQIIKNTQERIHAGGIHCQIWPR